MRRGAGMLGAAVRGVLAAFGGFVAWQIPAISHGYARVLAEGVRWSLALATGRATRLVDTPSTVAPGVGIVVAPVRLGADPIGLPLAWTHLSEVGIGLFVFAAMLVAWGAWPSNARPPRFGVRAVAGASSAVPLQRQLTFRAA